MGEEWESLALGDCLTRAQRPVNVEDLTVVPFAGVRWYAEGVYHRVTESAKSVSTKRLSRIARGDITYNRMWASKAAFGVVNEDADGCLVTTDFPVYTAGDCVIPEWIELIFQTRAFQHAASVLATGTTERRRLKERDFEKISIPVPPLAVQRRIVDLMAHLDTHITNLRAEFLSGSKIEKILIEGLVAELDGVESRPLGEMGVFLRGRRFTKADYVSEGIGCIHYGQVHTHFGPLAENVLTYVPVEMKSRLRFASTGNVVIAATSEDFEGLGKATVWLGSEDIAVHDDCYIYQHEMDPKFASYVIASPSFQRQKRQFGDGTKVTRISSTDLATISVEVPQLQDQITVGETLSCLTRKNAEVLREIESLSVFRGAILTQLLSGDLGIPVIYDTLLPEVA